MRSINSIIIFTLMLIQFSLVAAAQEGRVGALGTDVPLYQKYDETTRKHCFVYDRYVIRIVPSKSDGDDTFIFRRNAATDFTEDCADSDAPPHITMPADDFNNFYGLAGDILLIDSGTSAGVRELDIVSLVSKKVLFSTSYISDVKVAGSAIIYNQPSDVKGSLKNCPNYRKWRKIGGGEAWVRPTRFDLATLKETSAGALKCVYLE